MSQDLDFGPPLELDTTGAEPSTPSASPRKKRGSASVWLVATVLAAGPAGTVYFVRVDDVAELELESERAIADPMRVRRGEVRAPSQLAGEIERGKMRAGRDAGIAGFIAMLAFGVAGRRLTRK